MVADAKSMNTTTTVIGNESGTFYTYCCLDIFKQAGKYGSQIMSYGAETDKQICVITVVINLHSGIILVDHTTSYV